MYQVLCKVMGTNGKQDLVLYSDAREKGIKVDGGIN